MRSELRLISSDKYVAYAAISDIFDVLYRDGISGYKSDKAFREALDNMMEDRTHYYWELLEKMDEQE